MSETRILLIEDNPDDADILEISLHGFDKQHFILHRAERMEEAAAVLAEKTFDLILLDLNLPDSFGLETLKELKKHSRRIPVIIMTGNADEELAIKAVQMGGQDYLVKGSSTPSNLVRSINYAIERNRLVDELQQANEKILEQQKALIQEERLKVILQMSGAGGDKLDSPLTVLKEEIQTLTEEEYVSSSMMPSLRRIRQSVKTIEGIFHDVRRTWNRRPELPPGKKISDQEISRLTIVILEEDENEYKGLLALLSRRDEEDVLRFPSFKEMKKALKGKGPELRPDIIISNYQLRGGTVLELIGCEECRKNEIPVIVISDRGDEMIAAEVIQAGAAEYLPRNRLDRTKLLQCIRSAVARYSLKKEMNQSMEKMAELAVRDALTGLYNRRYFSETLERVIAVAERHSRVCALCLIDIDDFKTVNDTYGHPAGDYVIRTISQVMNGSFRKSDIPCRYGGDEYAVILPDSGEEETRRVAERFRSAMAATEFSWEGVPFPVNVSIGFSVHSQAHSVSMEELISAADKALYSAKEAGKNRVSCAYLWEEL